MTRKTAVLLAIWVVALTGGAAEAAGGNVKVTPLGSHDGEFCPSTAR